MKMMTMTETNSEEIQAKVRSKGFRKKLVGKVSDGYDKKTAMVRSRYVDRWNKICGGQYTLDNPIVHLEWELCDMKNQHLLMKGKREEFFERAKLSDIEKEIYLTGNCDGDPYTLIETMKIRKETARAVKMVTKRQL